MTTPARNRSAVRASSSRCRSNTSGGPTVANAGSTQVLKLSALTASGITTAESPAPSSRATSADSALICVASRTSACPADVAVTGLLRTTSTRPTLVSNALIRWLTAEGVTCSTRAAASNVPSVRAALRASSWARSRSIISHANAR